MDERSVVRGADGERFQAGDSDDTGLVLDKGRRVSDSILRREYGGG